MAYRTVLVLMAALVSNPILQAQVTTDELINDVYGSPVERPDGYAFSHVIHYSLLQRVDGGEGRPPSVIDGNMDLYFTPGDSAYARVFEYEEATMTSIGDLRLNVRFNLSNLGEVKVGSESSIHTLMADTLRVMRVSGDREIDGRMSAHYWFEEGTRIDELWADSESNEMETAIGRLWPRFEPGFQSLATGTYEGLVTRWISIDTRFSREPRTALQFKGIEELETPVEISLEGYTFPISEGEMMRRRLEAERQ